MSLCCVAPKAAPAGIVMKDESWVAVRLLQKKEARVDSYYLLLNQVRKCIWDLIFKQLPAPCMLFTCLFYVTSYTEAVHIYQTIHCCTKDHFPYPISIQFQLWVVLFLLLLLLTTMIISNEFGQHFWAAMGS